jgi:hypothetical protein
MAQRRRQPQQIRPTEQGFPRRVVRLAGLPESKGAPFRLAQTSQPNCAGRFGDDKARRAVAGLGAGLDRGVCTV